jgi:transposase-like protein
MMAADSDLFKGRHFDQQVIVLCVRYLSYKLSSRDSGEHDGRARDGTGTHDHSALGAEVRAGIREALGRWTYLYRAVDKQGRTVDFLLSKRRDVIPAKRFFAKR